MIAIWMVVAVFSAAKSRSVYSVRSAIHAESGEQLRPAFRARGGSAYSARQRLANCAKIWGLRTPLAFNPSAEKLAPNANNLENLSGLVIPSCSPVTASVAPADDRDLRDFQVVEKAPAASSANRR